MNICAISFLYTVAVPLIISYNPSIGRRDSLSLQNCMIGCHSSFERGMPSPRPKLTSDTTLNPFLKADKAFVGKEVSAGGGRCATRRGIGHLFSGFVGNDKRGPQTVMRDPKARGDSPLDAAASCFILEISERHHLSPNSTATVPPWAKPKMCIRSVGHEHSDVRCFTTL